MRKIMWMGVLVLVTACSTESELPVVDSSSPFVGAWLIAETTKTTPDSSWTDTSPQPGLYVFSGSHFSNMLVDGSNARVPFPPGGASPEQRLAAYDPFIADAGSYEFSDSILTTQNIIAKVPNVMTAQIVYRYHFSADTLTLTFRGAWAPPDGEITYRLVRLPESR